MACLGNPDLGDVKGYFPEGKGALEASESTLERWRAQYGRMKCEEAKRLKHLEHENQRLEQLVADQALDIQMLNHLSEGNW